MCGAAADKKEANDSKIIAMLMAVRILLMAGCSAPAMEEDAATYFFPSEEVEHEDTWLAWPHKYADKQAYYFGEAGIDAEVYAQMLEPTWIEITKALHTGETVHIIVYNEQEQEDYYEKILSCTKTAVILLPFARRRKIRKNHKRKRETLNGARISLRFLCAKKRAHTRRNVPTL